MQKTTTHTGRALVLLLALLLLTGLAWAQPQQRDGGDDRAGADAGQTPETGDDGAGEAPGPEQEADDGADIEAVAEAMLRTEVQLTALLDEVPETARKGLERAIAASREGRQKAMAALGRAVESRPAVEAGAEVTAESRTDAAVEDGEGHRLVGAQGVVRARVAIDASSRRAERALARTMSRVEGEARESIRLAIDHVRAGADQARTLLARVERPERPDRIETAATATAGLDAGIRLPSPR